MVKRLATAAKTGKTSAPKRAKAKPAASGRAVKPPTAAQRLDAVGIEEVCARITKGESITAIAQSVGLDQGSLRYWIASDPSRSAQAREARAVTAGACDDEALQRIDDAKDPFELAKAREAAQHLRWRASKIAPKDYGDKTTLAGDPGNPLKFDVSLSVSFVKPVPNK